MADKKSVRYAASADCTKFVSEESCLFCLSEKRTLYGMFQCPIVVPGVHVLNPDRRDKTKNWLFENRVNLVFCIYDTDVSAMLPHVLDGQVLFGTGDNMLAFGFAFDEQNTALAYQDLVRDASVSDGLKLVVGVAIAYGSAYQIVFNFGFWFSHGFIVSVTGSGRGCRAEPCP